MKQKPESKSIKHARMVTASIQSEKINKVVKYIQNKPGERAKPVYVSSQGPKPYITRFHIADDFTKQVIVEPAIESEDPPIIRRLISSQRNRTEELLTQPQEFITSPQEAKKVTLTASQIHKLERQQLNKLIFNRLGLLSQQAKRQLEIDRLQQRALKARYIESIPSFSNNQLAIVAKQIQLAENDRYATVRLATTPSGAARAALDRQENFFNQMMNTGRYFSITKEIKENRPKTQEFQQRIKTFYNKLANIQIDNKDDVRAQTDSVQKTIDIIKLSLCENRKMLLDRNDEIEQALIDGIKDEVIEYKNLHGKS